MYILTTCLFLFLSNYLTFAEFPIRCKKNDQINECLSAAVEDAMQKLPGFDPFKIPSVPVKSNGTDLKLTAVFTNYEMHNNKFKDVKAKAHMDFEENALGLEINFAELHHKFDCAFNGTFRGESVSGHGSGVCVARNEKFHLRFIFEEYTKDNRKYYKIKDTQLSVAVGSNVWNFEKYEGDMQMEKLEHLINENIDVWLEGVVRHFVGPFKTICQNTFDAILSTIPKDELFPEE